MAARAICSPSPWCNRRPGALRARRRAQVVAAAEVGVRDGLGWRKRCAPTLRHPAALSEDRGRVSVTCPARVETSELDQVNNSAKSEEPTGLIRYRSIPASRASSRPGCSVSAVKAISLRDCSCGC